MNDLAKELKSQYGYTSYELALVKYALVSILSELSKLFILGIFFYLTNHFTEFIFSMVLLFLLRLNIGGLHCKHYITCFLLTFIVSYSSVTLLPKICSVSPTVMIIFSVIDMIICFAIGPIASPFRPTPDNLRLKRCRYIGLIVFCIFIFFVSIFQTNVAFFNYLQVGFWTITLHTAQMLIAKISKKEEDDINEENQIIQHKQNM